VNEKIPEIILTIFTELQDHDESTSKEEDVKINNDDLIAKKDYILFYPSGLETPGNVNIEEGRAV
jgi:hypothetical protein